MTLTKTEKDILGLEQPEWVQNSTLAGFDRRRIIDDLFSFITVQVRRYEGSEFTTVSKKL